jgi:hypothetical protein
MDPVKGIPAGRSAASLADAQDVRAGIAAALKLTPVNEPLLRRGVWTYVGAERSAGTSPGHVIMALSELVESSDILPMSVRQALMRHVMLWCVEAYFGHLGGDVVGHSSYALSDSTPMPVLR